jgi:xylan 1,4-beta-xylosidase
MKQITNPILPRFNPDPTIVRVGDDYYIAVSTFEWFPGIVIYHSRDLIHWNITARPLNRLSQLNMTGNPDSGGIWAPCLTYHGGLFYLVYTDVKSLKGIWRDMPNYLVTAENIEGPWSDPIYLNHTGHDPSLFHDDDGRKWLTQVNWEYKHGRNVFSGIVMQEYLPDSQALTGPKRIIFKGTEFGFTEAPHIYKRNGYYYLITAEGGTWYNHCVTMARSRSIEGPYEIHPQNPILTAKEDAGLALQKAGHADLVETKHGEWYMVYLCSRPLETRGRCVLGRETAIQKVEWREDDWLYLSNRTNKPDQHTPAPDLPEYTFSPLPIRDDFDHDSLSPVFHTLRVSLSEEILSLTKRKGYLRLAGRDSFASTHIQSFIARRQQSFNYRAETCVEFFPESSKQMAGLAAYYNTDNYFYLCVSYLEASGSCLRIICCSKGEFSEPTEDGISINEVDRIYLRYVVNCDQGQFYYSFEGSSWLAIGPVLDAGKLSDDYIGGRSFTGGFIGVCCQDLAGDHKFADFDYFEYQDL